MKKIIESYGQIISKVRYLQESYFDDANIHLALIELNISAYHDTLDKLKLDYCNLKYSNLSFNFVFNLTLTMMNDFIEKTKIELSKNKRPYFILTAKGEEVMNDLIQAVEKSLEWLKKVDLNKDKNEQQKGLVK